MRRLRGRLGSHGGRYTRGVEEGREGKREGGEVSFWQGMEIKSRGR